MLKLMATFRTAASRRSLVGLFFAAALFALPLFAFAQVYGGGNYGSGSYAGVAPSVTTSAASSITDTTATLNGTISSIGTSSPTVRGFAVGLTTAYGATTTESGSFSTGAFTTSATSLSCNTLYHFRAYATNINGTGYGSDTTFTTSACIVVTTTPVVISSGNGGGAIVGSGPNAIGYVNTNPTGATTTTSGSTATTPTTSGSSLTEAQVQSILSILQSFGADQSVIDSVSASLRGSASASSFTRDLELGSIGDDVRALQVYLNNHGYSVAASGPGSSGNETTKFGAGTRAALIKFQKANSITPAAGYFGPKTRAFIK